MTPFESKGLRGLGIAYFESIEALSIFVFFYGVFVILFFMSVATFVRKGFPNREIAAMFAATVINFLLFSLSTGTQVAQFIVFIRTALILYINYPLVEDQELVNNAIEIMTRVGGWAQAFPPLVSDLIVIWRAWAIFPGQRRIILAPLLLWVAAVGMTIAYQVRFGGFGNGDHLFNASLALSIGTNAVTTMMIAYKLWNYRMSILKIHGLSGRKSPAQTILILLVESGLIFLGFQIVYFALDFDTSAWPLATFGFQVVYFSLSAIYPTVVIVLVESQRSMADICEISPSIANRMAGPAASETYLANLGHLSLAVAPIHSTTDNEAESQRPRALQARDGQEHALTDSMLEVKESLGQVGTNC